MENRTLIQKDIMEIPSYCFNSSSPNTHDKELGDLRQQLIFWVEGQLPLLSVAGLSRFKNSLDFISLITILYSTFIFRGGFEFDSSCWNHR